MKTKMRACAGILGALLAGCGSSSNLGEFSSSIDGMSHIDQLTPQQRQTLCSEAMSFAESSGLERDALDLFCRQGSILAAYFTGTSNQTDAELRAICKSNYDTCLAQPSSGTCASTIETGTCTATVAEFSICVNDLFKLTEMTSSSTPTCDQVTAAKLWTSTTTTPVQPQPTSCDAYAQKCPGAMM